MLLPYLYNSYWMASCYREARKFSRDSRNVRKTQTKLLLKMINQNRDTWYGTKHRFATIRDIKDFQQAVPLSTYDTYRTAIDDIARGNEHVLTKERVELFEPTGGTSTGEKLIPYTASLHHSFQKALEVWIWNLFLNRPQVRSGRAYWSISPLANYGRTTESGIPIGFNHDAAYLGNLQRWLVQKTMAVPGEIAMCSTVEYTQYATLFFLLRTVDLSLISVWSPTFLTALLQLVWNNWERLTYDIEHGKISCHVPEEECQLNRQTYKPLPERADYLRHVFTNAADVSECIRFIWPTLALVSCWTDGPSRSYANRLQQLIPGVEIQGKGLLATEAFVTIPLISQPAPALAIRSNFYEFQPVDSRNNTVFMADELQIGKQYRVVVTTPGGLYRYQMEDQVKVVGFSEETPLLEFIGKSDDTSDLVGEKLSAAHVSQALQEAFQFTNLSPTFSQLQALSSDLPRYTLRLVEPMIENNQTLQTALLQALESKLQENPGYKYARSLGQLQELRLEVISSDQADVLVENLVSERIAAGQRAGDIKLSLF